MRRVQPNDTFHGTAAGQAPNITDIELRFGLTERQAQCAALLRMGTPTQGVAEVLGISVSTLETHMGELRRVIGASTTEELRTKLNHLIPDAELSAFHCWPARTNTLATGIANDPVFAARLRTSFSVEQALGALQAELTGIGVQHIYYCYLPHSVQGFLRGDVIDAFLGPNEIKSAFDASGGLASQPIAQRLLEAPTDVPVLRINAEDCPQSVAAFYKSCLNYGATHLLSLGFPAGPAFVGMAMILALDDSQVADIEEQAEAVRAAAMAVHAAVLTNGTLAARVRLTLKERNALSALALGKHARESAKALNVSERAFAKLTASARAKLNAGTNAEAVGKAVLINALVFL